MRRIFLFPFVFLFFSAVFPWGDAGHKVIAYIAEKNLSLSTLEKVKAILPDSEDLESISVWADNIKYYRRETKPWHYIDFPIRKDIGKKDIPEYFSINGSADANIISQINKEIKELKDKNTSIKIKREDLKFLVHFIGDLHMPLHCSDDNDRGGNEKKVVFFEPASTGGSRKTMTLHALWDKLIEIDPIENPEMLGDQLNKKITKIQKRQWRSGSIEDWAYESYNIAKTVVYKGFTAGPSKTTLPRDYYSKMRPYVDEQLAKAGIRLALVLEMVFEK